MENQINHTTKRFSNRTTFIGTLLVLAGVTTLLKHAGLWMFPHFIFSWPVILIIVGLAIGAKNNFQKSNWMVITGIGVLFLFTNIIPSLHIVMLWPIVLVALGIRLLTRHNQYWNGTNWEKRNDVI